jgi:hypothetical protein
MEGGVREGTYNRIPWQNVRTLHVIMENVLSKVSSHILAYLGFLGKDLRIFNFTKILWACIPYNSKEVLRIT